MPESPLESAAAVAHGDLDQAQRLADIDVHGTVGRAVLHGIADEVREELPEPHFVDPGEEEL